MTTTEERLQENYCRGTTTEERPHRPVMEGYEVSGDVGRLAVVVGSAE